MTITDYLLIGATLLSPVIAVQVQKFIERATERRAAQKRIFQVLMATRATRVAPDHVQALNMIDLEFSGSGWRRQTAKEREVVNRWRIYANHLNVDGEMTEAQMAAWTARSNELFTDLLEALSAAMGYAFDRVQLMRGIYRPRAHNQAELRREVFEQALVDVVTGASPISMRVTEFPVSDELIDLQRSLQERMLGALNGDGALRVRQVPDAA